LNTYQSLSELIKAGRKAICSESHKPIGSIRNNEELLQEWQQSITVYFYKKGLESSL
jgi:hypothetical protein